MRQVNATFPLELVYRNVPLNVVHNILNIKQKRSFNLNIKQLLAL